MGRIRIENNRFISRGTQTHPSETAIMKGNISFEMDISISLFVMECFAIVMEVSSKSPRVSPGVGWGIYQFSVPEG